MSKLRSISTAFWSDPFIEKLKPVEKLLFIYLITNEKTNMLGIYEASIGKMAFETGINEGLLVNALKGFEKIGKVKYINHYVILVNFLKHQNFNTNMKKSAIDVYNSLPNELKDKKLCVTKDNPSKGFETLLNHYGMVSKVEVEVLEDESNLIYLKDVSSPPDGVDILHFYIAKGFYNLFLLKGETKTLLKAKVVHWVKIIRLLINEDKVTLEQLVAIKYYFEKCQQGDRQVKDWWFNNINSVAAFRKKDKDNEYHYDKITKDIKVWVKSNPDIQAEVITRTKKLKEKTK